MTPPARREPTEAELRILKTLWQLGPSTVRDVHDVLGKSAGTGYTTVLKLLQIMLEKKLVKRDDRRRPHVYSPTSTKDQTQRHLLRGLRDRAFQGSAKNLVVQALNTGRVSPEELAEIRQLLDELEARSDDTGPGVAGREGA